MHESKPALFRGRHFRTEIIVLRVRWYLSPNRDLIAAKGFLRLALSAGQTAARHQCRRSSCLCICDRELKQEGDPGWNCKCRPSPYLNDIIEKDHRFVKNRVITSQGFWSVEGALSSIAGYEVMNIIRKGQIRWLPKGDVVGQKRFIERIFGIAA